MISRSNIDNSKIIPEAYELANNFSMDALQTLPIDTTQTIETLDNSTVFIQNFILKELDNGMIKLEMCNPEEPVQESVHYVENEQVGLDVLKNRSLLKKQNKALEYHNVKKSCLSSDKAVEVPVISKSIPKESVVHYSPSQKPKSPPSFLPQLVTQELLVIPKLGTPKIGIEHGLSCTKCRKEFGEISSFRKHLKWHRAPKIFNCTKCAVGFNAENNLKIHLVTSHLEYSNACPVCEVKFQRKASLKSHILVHQIEELFTCDDCHAEFESDDELVKHSETHALAKIPTAPNNQFVCPYCKLDFETTLEYKQHIDRHIDIKKNVLKGKKTRRKRAGVKMIGFKCEHCDYTFKKGCLLERHLRTHTGEKPYICPFCNRGFAQKGTLQIHMVHHTGVKPYSCTLCPAKFNQKGNLRAHINKTHTANGDQKMYRCTQCACIFKKVATLNGHVTKVHINQTGTKISNSEHDSVIDQVMNNLKLLKEAGEKNKEPNSIQNPKNNSDTNNIIKLSESQTNGSVRRYLIRQKKIGDVRWYFCNYCSNRFKKPSDLMRHFRVHTHERPFKCTKCRSSFALKSTLMTHSKTHMRPGYECVYCNSTFLNSRCLNAHIRKHQKSKVANFICILCEQVFSSLEKAKEHRLVHESEIQSTQNIIEPILKQPLFQTPYGSLTLKPPKPKLPNTGIESPLERPHHCKICDARFTRLISLRRHVLNHSGDKKFKCNICPKAFVTKYRLTEHLNFHKNIRNFTCEICTKQFVTRSLLKRHLIVHNTSRPYSCPYCDKTYKTLLLCRTHIKNVHKLNVTGVEKRESPSEYVKNVSQTSVLDSGNNLYKLEENRLLPKYNQQQQSIKTVPPTNQPKTQPNSLILNISQEDQRDSNQAYKMVYLNLGDIQNEALLFNSLHDLQDSTVLFNIDPKSDMVDPNEVIRSTLSSKTSPVISKIAHQSQASRDDVASLQGSSGKFGVSHGGSLGSSNMEGYADMELALPINFVVSKDQNIVSPLVSADVTLTSNEMFHDAQVICVNCQKMFCDMSAFHKHNCSKNGLKNTSNLLETGNTHSKSNSENREFNFVCKEKKSKASVQDKDRHSVNILQDILIGLPTTNTNQSTIQTEPKEIIQSNKYNQVNKGRGSVEKNNKDKVDARVFRCPFCLYASPCEDTYQKHISLIHPDTLYRVCKFCLKEFKKPSDLIRHLRTHTGEKPFSCDLCPKKFTLKSTLESHARTHGICAKQFVCVVCNTSFGTKSSYNVHLLLHTGERPHGCSFCDENFRTSATRKAHEQNIHLRQHRTSLSRPKKSATSLLKAVAEEVASNVKNGKDNGNSFDCMREPQHPDLIQQPLILNTPQSESLSIDPVIFLQQLQNSGIVLSTESDTSVPINLNDITLVDYKTLEQNGGNLGVNVNLELDDVSALLGGHESVNTEKDYGTPRLNQNIEQTNIILETTANPTKIPSAPPKFILPKPLKKSPKPKKETQKVECEICHKIYASKDVLRKHKKNVHGQNKKFPCIKCDRGYESLEELNKHIVKVHTGLRTYFCEYCDNSFGEEGSLKTHIKRIHQKSLISQETDNALLSLQFDLPLPTVDSSLL